MRTWSLAQKTAPSVRSFQRSNFGTSSGAREVTVTLAISRAYRMAYAAMFLATSSVADSKGPKLEMAVRWIQTPPRWPRRICSQAVLATWCEHESRLTHNTDKNLNEESIVDLGANRAFLARNKASIWSYQYGTQTYSGIIQLESVNL